MGAQRRSQFLPSRSSWTWNRWRGCTELINWQLLQELLITLLGKFTIELAYLEIWNPRVKNLGNVGGKFRIFRIQCLDICSNIQSEFYKNQIHTAPCFTRRRFLSCVALLKEGASLIPDSLATWSTDLKNLFTAPLICIVSSNFAKHFSQRPPTWTWRQTVHWQQLCPKTGAPVRWWLPGI